MNRIVAIPTQGRDATQILWHFASLLRASSTGDAMKNKCPAHKNKTIPPKRDRLLTLE